MTTDFQQPPQAPERPSPQRVKERVRAMGVTTTQLGRELNRSHVLVVNALNGKGYPGVLIRIERALDRIARKRQRARDRRKQAA